MKIWKLWSDCDRYAELDVVIHMELEELQTFDGRSKKDSWVTQKVREIKTKHKLPLGNYSNFDLPIFDRKALDALLPLIQESVEVLPLEYRLGENYYFINVITVLDCIDYAKSEYKRFESSNRIMCFYKYEFIENIISGYNLFRIIDEPISELFVSDKFKEAVEEANLTGFRFELVWDSEGEIPEIESTKLNIYEKSQDINSCLALPGGTVDNTKLLADVENVLVEFFKEHSDEKFTELTFDCYTGDITSSMELCLNTDDNLVESVPLYKYFEVAQITLADFQVSIRQEKAMITAIAEMIVELSKTEVYKSIPKAENFIVEFFNHQEDLSECNSKVKKILSKMEK